MPNNEYSVIIIDSKNTNIRFHCQLENLAISAALPLEAARLPVVL